MAEMTLMKILQGYSRKGAALAFMNRHEEAVMAYEETLKINPDNDQAKQAIEESKSQLTGGIFQILFL